MANNFKGKNIRTITRNGISCVSMPKIDSYILMTVDVESLSDYTITIDACKIGGSGKLDVEFTGNHVYGNKGIINVFSSNFSSYKIKLFLNTASTDITLLRVQRSNSSGTVLIKSILCEKTVIEERPKVNIALQNETANIESKELLNTILISRGKNMAIIGGSGYRWRGKNIKTIFKDNTNCIEMPSQDSVIMVPISAVSEAEYFINVIASCHAGNGSLLVHFFGGKNFDGKCKLINVVMRELREYTFKVNVPKFPNNFPMYLRLWRPDDSIGKITIKTIQYSTNNQRGQHLNPEKRIIASKKKVVKISNSVVIKPKTEETSMKFRPYELRKSTEMADRVLITQPEDVPKVSIITPTREGRYLLERCYNALIKNTDYPNWEWIIGDSNSIDGTNEWATTLTDSKVKFIQRGTTDGSFSSINNELVKHATGEYLLFLNNDTEPQPFWLYEMMSKIHNDPEIGIVGARLMYSADRIQHAGIAFIPQGPANIGKAVLKSFPENFAYSDRYFQAVTGACMLMRTKDFEAIGGFDPIYYFCYEDVDLCLKIGKQLNKKIYYAANAVVYHLESITQNQFKTSGALQQEGIKVFKERWMSDIDLDFVKFQTNNKRGLLPIDVSFVTCVNNMNQYRNYVLGSLFKNHTKKNYETIPILNFGNPHSASQALNIGINKARSNIMILCHQDVIFYENWVDMLFERITEIEVGNRNWGVLGTAGITTNDDTIGVVHNVKGSIQWQSTKRVKIGEVQTVDEHCMIIRKSSGLRFDEKIFNGWHFYGPDICMNALNAGMKNYGILCPLVHDSSSGSLASGRKEFMRLLSALAKKWRFKFDFIRTPTSVIRKKQISTFVRFKS